MEASSRRRPGHRLRTARTFSSPAPQFSARKIMRKRFASCEGTLPARRNLSGRMGVSPAGFGILPKQSFQVRDRETRSPAGETPTLPETNVENETRHQLLARRNFLNAFFVLESALFVMISEAPAWFDAKKRAAVGPERQIRDAGEIYDNRSSARPIGKGEH